MHVLSRKVDPGENEYILLCVPLIAYLAGDVGDGGKSVGKRLFFILSFRTIADESVLNCVFHTLLLDLCCEGKEMRRKCFAVGRRACDWRWEYNIEMKGVCEWSSVNSG